jgi:hypothetical protein
MGPLTTVIIGCIAGANPAELTARDGGDGFALSFCTVEIALRAAGRYG